MTKFEEEFKALTSWDWVNVDLIQQILTRFGNWHSDEDFQKMVEIGGEFALANENFIDVNTKLAEEIANLKSQLQQQALPVVPECVAGAIESIPDHYSAFEAIDLIKSKVETLPEENKDWLQVYNWLCEGVENQDTFALAFITGKYQVEKPQLFKLIFPNSTAVLQKDGELNSFADTVYKIYLIGNAMTEQEIKSIDERYWQFAVPVEDGE